MLGNSAVANADMTTRPRLHRQSDRRLFGAVQQPRPDKQRPDPPGLGLLQCAQRRCAIDHPLWRRGHHADSHPESSIAGTSTSFTVTVGSVKGLALVNCTLGMTGTSLARASATSAYNCTPSGGGNSNSITANIELVDGFDNPAIGSTSNNETVSLGGSHVNPARLTIVKHTPVSTAPFMLSMNGSNSENTTIT